MSIAECTSCHDSKFSSSYFLVLSYFSIRFLFQNTYFNSFFCIPIPVCSCIWYRFTSIKTPRIEIIIPELGTSEENGCRLYSSNGILCTKWRAHILFAIFTSSLPGVVGDISLSDIIVLGIGDTIVVSIGFREVYKGGYLIFANIFYAWSFTFVATDTY